MVLRGFIASVVFTIGWLALIMTSRPHVAGVATDRNAVLQAIANVETWSFTPALLDKDERATYESARQVEDAHAALAGADGKIGARLPVCAALTVLGVLAFWGGILLFARGRVRVAAVALAAVGPFLACLEVRGWSGLLISGPPIATGVVIALISLISRRFSPQS